MAKATPKRPDPADHVELLTAKELAALLKMESTDSLYTAVSRGHVPRGVRIPGLGLRWDRAKIDRWLRDRLDAAE